MQWLPQGSSEERRQWSGDHPWRTGFYFGLFIAAPLLLISWFVGELLLVALSLILATASGGVMVWAIKTDWSPRSRL